MGAKIVRAVGAADIDAAVGVDRSPVDRRRSAAAVDLDQHAHAAFARRIHRPADLDKQTIGARRGDGDAFPVPGEGIDAAGLDDVLEVVSVALIERGRAVEVDHQVRLAPEARREVVRQGDDFITVGGVLGAVDAVIGVRRGRSRRERVVVAVVGSLRGRAAVDRAGRHRGHGQEKCERRRGNRQSTESRSRKTRSPARRARDRLPADRGTFATPLRFTRLRERSGRRTSSQRFSGTVVIGHDP